MVTTTLLREAGPPTLQSRPLSSMAQAAVWMPALAFTATGLRALRDPDVWWHLRAGEIAAQGIFVVPARSPGTRPWILHSWLSDWFFYVAHQVGGLPGVVALHVLLLALLGALVVLIVRPHGATSPALIVGFTTVAVLIPYSGERPQLLSFALMCVLAGVVLRALSLDRPPWPCIPLALLWGNVHGLWPAVALVVGATALGLASQRRIARALAWLSVATVSAVVPVVGPLGLDVFRAPFHVWQIQHLVSEWATHGWTEPWSILVLLLAMAATAAAWRDTALRPYIGALIAVLALGVGSSRFLPLAAIVAAPLATAWLQKRRESSSTVIGTGGRAYLLVTLALLSLTPFVPPTRAGTFEEAPRAIAALPGRPTVLTTPALGSRILWYAPRATPSVDGRFETYSAGYLKMHMDAVSTPQKLTRLTERIRPDAAWLPTNSPAVAALRQAGWRSITMRDVETVLLFPRTTHA